MEIKKRVDRRRLKYRGTTVFAVGAHRYVCRDQVGGLPARIGFVCLVEAKYESQCNYRGPPLIIPACCELL